jgi:phospholipase/carboxylesterase
MTYQPLQYVYHPSGSPTAHTLLLLHGTGGDEQDLIPLAGEFGGGFNILSLRGNVSEGGMPRFFKRLGMGVFDEQDLSDRTHEMVTFIQTLGVKENFDATKIIALGYSNGANIAGGTLVLYPDFFAGAILYRPMQPFKHIDGRLHSSRKIPVFMSNGSADPTIDPGATEAYAGILRKAGFEVTDVSVAAGHNLSKQDLALSVDWFGKHFGQATATGVRTA